MPFYHREACAGKPFRNNGIGALRNEWHENKIFDTNNLLWYKSSSADSARPHTKLPGAGFLIRRIHGPGWLQMQGVIITMHIADGILSPEISVAAGAVSVGALYVFGKKAASEDIPKMGIMAAALFVASLIHFPVAGTSVHLGLFGLAGILLGFRSIPVVFTALLFQSLLFQHGGLLSLGVNVINMSAGAVGACLLWRIRFIPEAARAFLAGFAGILLPALLMAAEFEISGYGRGIYYLMSIYVIVAGIEGVLTAVIVEFFRKVEPGLLTSGS